MTPQGVSRALRARNVNVQSGEYATITVQKGGPTGVSVWVNDAILISSQVERSLSAVEAALGAAGYDHYRSRGGTSIYVKERQVAVKR